MTIIFGVVVTVLMLYVIGIIQHFTEFVDTVINKYPVLGIIPSILMVFFAIILIGAFVREIIKMEKGRRWDKRFVVKGICAVIAVAAVIKHFVL